MGLPEDRRWGRRLDRYADAKRQGIQPRTTWPCDVDTALALSDHMGEAYRADRPVEFV
jgi:hypothetical protein